MLRKEVQNWTSFLSHICAVGQQKHGKFRLPAGISVFLLTPRNLRFLGIQKVNTFGIDLLDRKVNLRFTFQLVNKEHCVPAKTRSRCTQCSPTVAELCTTVPRLLK